MAAKSLLPGYRTAAPLLVVDNAPEAINYYKLAFDAEVTIRLEGAGGKVRYAEIKVGDSDIMISDEFPETGFIGPKSLGGSPVEICLFVEDVEAQFNKAVNAGAIVIRDVATRMYGDRAGRLEDPFGHHWTIRSV